MLGGTTFSETWNGGRGWTAAGSLDVLPETMAWADRSQGVLQGQPIVCPAGQGCSNDPFATVFFTNDGGRTWHQVPF